MWPFRKAVGVSPVRGPLPASVKAMAKERARGESVWPLRDSIGRTWAERKEMTK